jgi:hypothetical protein
MKKHAWALLIVTLLLLTVPLSQASGDGWHHGGVRVFIGGPPVWWGPYPYYYPAPYPYAAPYAAPYVVQQPAPVIVEQAPNYVSQTPAPPQSYWYYCQSAKAYYPNVQTCAETWIQVPPRSE